MGGDTLFYDRFTALCVQKGVSASFVVQQIGLNKSSATYWKNGAIPKGNTLQKLADYFDVSTDYLLGNVSEPFRYLDKRTIREIKIIAEDELTPPNRIAVALSKLNEDGQQKAVERVEELTEIPKYQRGTAPQLMQSPPEGKEDTALKEKPSEDL